MLAGLCEVATAMENENSIAKASEKHQVQKEENKHRSRSHRAGRGSIGKRVVVAQYTNRDKIGLNNRKSTIKLSRASI
jgi:hypothetical protein